MEKKMIDLTVRTLDSQNHPFNVEDDITIAQFKQHIADTVNIPADVQRIIYCGRVLSDESKLSDFDINGKVVHLVQRAPPSENRQNANRPRTPPTPNLLGGNAMYFGSMTFPLEPQNVIPPPPSHSLASSRLNVARRMLRRAEVVINLLENPSGTPPVVPDEAQEEVTPVFEARVIVPAATNVPIDSAFVINAVQDSIMNAVQGTAAASTTTPPVENNAQPVNDAVQETPAPAPARPDITTPDDFSPTSTSTDDEVEARNGNTASATNTSASNEAGSGSSNDNISRTSEMADLLETLGRLQVRFAPYLERYRTFMREDPVVDRSVRRTQTMMNRVSEVLHFLGHAYHSLSDIIITVRDTPARPLLCRPILLQHTAVVPTGFPIQVEAQINFTSENSAPRQTNSSTNTTNGATAATAATATTTTTANETSPAAANATATTVAPTPTAPTSARHATSNITVNPNIMIPLMPSAGVHALSFPIGIRSMRATSAANASANTNRSTTNTTAPPPATNNSTQANNTPPVGNLSSGFNNPNLEFFMEVTPESITIDSLETTLLGGNAGVRAGAPPPELIQSIVQMASQLVNRGASTSNIQQTFHVSQQSSNTNAQPQQSDTQSTQNHSGQNSQARGNTQTNPTTSTSTRSTARPHVHLAQHVMQGFDPFLPCNSHHIRRRRYGGRYGNNNNHQHHHHPQQQQQQPNNQQARTSQNGNSSNTTNPIINAGLREGLINSLQRRLRTDIQSRRTQQSSSAPNTTPPNNVGIDLNQLFSNMPNIAILPHIQNAFNSDFNSRGPTIAQLLHQTDEQPEGGIFNDLIVLLSRNLTISDMLQLNSERLEPLIRIVGTIRNFVTTRILEGNLTPANITNGVNRLITEFQPFIEHLSHLPVHDDIDIVRSTEMLFRTRLPNIIKLAAYLSPALIRSLVEQIKITFQHLCALILHASGNGQRGVEDVLEHIVVRYMEDSSPEIQQWSLLATRVQLQQFMRSLNVPVADLQPYIVRKDDAVAVPTPQLMDLDMQNEIDLDQASSSATTKLGVINLENDNDLPAVVLGAETWHNQVPSDWVPIITRDSQQRQRRQSQQSPLSDAYLSGMPSKRRKIVSNSKPHGTLPQVISESLKRAVTSTGLSSVGNLDSVAQEAAADLSIQSAYKELLRSRVQSSVQNNEDFTPDRFPNAYNYFNKSQ